jgi:hypothetical protein
MKITNRFVLAALMLLAATMLLFASGTVGIYGIVSKVVFEPSDKAPERIQIWGAFTLVNGGTSSGGTTLTPKRGYLYFTLPGTENPSQRETALKEWADFKAIAGTGQAVAFGRFGYLGVFSENMNILMAAGTANSNGSRAEYPVRSESAAATMPAPYPLNMGLTKLSGTGDLAAIVKQLQQALKL